MKAKSSMTRRIISFLLCFAMVLSLVPVTAIPMAAVTRDDNDPTVSDASTLNAWKKYFGEKDPNMPNDYYAFDGLISTEHVGGIWTDKSVFDNDKIDTLKSETGIDTLSLSNDNNFLAVLSAIGSNETVSGKSHSPTDTFFVLDVSGSMQGQETNLVNATNSAIKRLLELNSHNRVGIILFSNGASVLLPLGRYKTDSDGKYVEVGYNGYYRTISLDSDVVIEGTSTRPDSTSRSVVGGTYTQYGVIEAIEKITDSSISTTVNDPTLGTLRRKPVIVLMADGAATYGDEDYDNPPSSYSFGNGEDPTSTLAIVNQLSLAYAKYKLTEKYGDSLIYTLAFNINGRTDNRETSNDDSVALSILNPMNVSPITAQNPIPTENYYNLNSNIESTVNTFWTRYDAATMNSNVSITSRFDYNTIEKKYNGLSRNYTNGFFLASSSNALETAFGNIVGAIEKASEYHPTLISGDANLSGYVSFVDKIGQYMEVKKVNGIIIEDTTSQTGGTTIFTGSSIASHFTSTKYDPPAGLIDSVQERLGIDETTASTLIRLAYDNGQLKYTDEYNYSNYIGWYAGESINYLGFYNEGTTTTPTNAKYKVRSYGYIGDSTHGVEESDLMYVVVQIREDLTSGEQTVVFSVPANLLPIVTYNITLNEKDEITALSIDDSIHHPIRFVYEIGLKDKINEFTVSDPDVVSKEYLEQEYLSENEQTIEKPHVNADGSVNFYTNQWSNQVEYQQPNTYAYFRPSKANPLFFFTEDSLIYKDANGTAFYDPNEAQPTDGYHKITIYKKDASGIKTETVYSHIADKIFDSATAVIKKEDGWYVAKNTAHAHINEFEVEKVANATDTNSHVKNGYIDTNQSGVHNSDPNTSYVVGYSLGNNGVITVTPTTGLSISKTVEGATTDQAFTFTIKGTVDNGTYKAYIFSGNSRRDADVVFQNDIATVQLKDGERIFIGGLDADVEFTITETPVEGYIVSKINNQETTVNSTKVTTVSNKFETVSFVNTERKLGNVSITKVVTHDFGADYQLPDKSFEITLSFPVELANQTFGAVSSIDGNAKSVVLDSEAKAKIWLTHNETWTINGIPVGTQIGVNEAAYPGFNNSQGFNGSVTVIENQTNNIIVTNDYNAGQASDTITISGSKTFEGRENNDWLDSDEFTIKLVQIDNNITKTINTITLDKNNNEFNFTIPYSDWTTIGTYYYHIYEEVGTIPGVNYDPTVYHIQVNVTDEKMDGSLEVSSVTYQDKLVVATEENGVKTYELTGADFKNKYAPKSTVATITIDKQVQNESNSPNASLEGWQFCVTEILNGVEQTPDFLDPTGVAGQAVWSKTFEAQGEYHYKITEIDQNKGNAWTNITQEIYITITVTDDANGNLVAEVTRDDENATTTNAAITVPFVNKYDPDDVNVSIDFIKKAMSGRNLTENDNFTFEIIDTNDNTIATGTSDKEGNVSFSPSSITFNKVGIYQYKVVETSQDGNGVTTDKTVRYFDVTVTDNNGKLNATVSVINGTNDNLVFTNTYTTSPKTFPISGNKKLIGRNLIANEFTFKLTETSANGTPIENGRTWTATNNEQGVITFDAITFDKAGTYGFTVEEVIPEQVEGRPTRIEYDTRVINVTVTVTDNGDGTLEVKQENDVSFENKYTPDPVSVTLNASKTLIGKQLNAGDYTFILSDASGSEKERKTNDASGLVTFEPIIISKDLFGDNREYNTVYYITEYKGNEGGITYDDTIYTANINAKWDEHGNITTTVTYTDNNGSTVNIPVFENTYNAGSVKDIIEGRKVLEGRPINENDKFEFVLTEANADGTIPTNAQHWNASNDENGHFYFSELEYKLGLNETKKEFYYTVEEIKGAAGGVTYDQTKYFITITVTDNGNGLLELTEKIEKITDTGRESAGIVLFTNNYKTGSAHATIEATKKLNGEITDKQFTFELYKSDENGNYDGNTALISRENDHNGKVYFTVNYEDESTTPEYFVIKEVNGGQVGMTYDPTEYLVKVDITDDGVGNLSTAVTYYNKNNPSQAISAGEVVFNNTYDAEDITDYKINGTKELKGNTGSTVPTFEFELLDSTGTVISNVRNNDNGAFEFTLGSFNQEGEYTYTVREKAGNEAQMTYDTTVYTVTINVEDINGKLTATQVIKKGNETVNGIHFVNIYTAPIDVNISAQKNYNITLEKDAFSFELYSSDANGLYTANNYITTINNEANGTITYTKNYTEATTEFFVIKEVNGGQKINGITYDGKEYLVKVEITDNNEGTLSSNVTYYDATNLQTPVSAIFNNTYNVTEEVHTIDGKKILKGKVLNANDFTFVLVETDANGNTLASQSAKNDADGNFSFDSITFSGEGKRYFIVTEQNDGKGGYEYDDSVYKVTVEALDNGDGTLSIIETVKKDDEVPAVTEETVENIIFTNNYATDSEKHAITGNKELSGRDLETGEFTFVLTQTEANFTTVVTENGVAKTWKTRNTQSGSFSFGDIEYKLETNETVKYFYYTVVEKDDNKGGVEYDETVYYVTIKVTDNNDGTVKIDQFVRKSTDSENVTNAKIRFNNTYDTAPIDIYLTATKTLNDKTPTREFEFELYKSNANGEAIEYIETIRNDENGDIKFNAIPVKSEDNSPVYYLIKEVNGGDTIEGTYYDKSKYLAKIEITDNGDGTLSSNTTYTLNGETVKSAEFKNTYTAAAANHIIDGVKSLVGKNIEGGEFTFILAESDANGNIVDGAKVWSTQNEKNGTFSFEQMTFATEGVHHFVLTEQLGNNTAVIYDETKYIVTLIVTDNKIGNLVVEETIRGGNDKDIIFKNIHISDPKTITIPGEKVLRGRDIRNGEFAFELYSANATNNSPLQTVYNDAAGNFWFNITYQPEDAGKTFRYVVKEANAGKTINAVTYSTDIYYVTVDVYNNNGVLGTNVSISSDYFQNTEITFVNYYNPAPVSTTFSGTKTIIGNRNLNAGEFTFELHPATAAFTADGSTAMTAVNSRFGYFVFDPVTFDKEGNYYFIVKESTAMPIEGIIYDKAKFHIIVEVRDNGTGSLYIDNTTVLRSYAGMETSAPGITFENIYVPNAVSTVISGSKVLHGKDLEAGEFRFNMTGKDGTSYIAYNGSDGSFTFDELRFTKAGTYIYSITEDTSENFEDIIYDKSVYTVTITVIDDGNGNLKVSEPIIEKMGSGKVNDIVFENTYDPDVEDKTVTLTINKTVKNIGYAEIGPENFEFVIENLVSGEKLYSKTDINGIATFTLTFDKEDIDKQFLFSLKEVNDGRDFMEYSTDEHLILVSVLLDENNELYFILGQDGKEVTELVANYTNIFNFDPVVEEEPEIETPDTSDDK